MRSARSFLAARRCSSASNFCTQQRMGMQSFPGQGHLLQSGAGVKDGKSCGNLKSLAWTHPDAMYLLDNRLCAA